MDVTKTVRDVIETALDDAEEAIGCLEDEEAFSSQKDSIWLRDDGPDTGWIQHNMAKLESSLDIVADELSQLIESDADEPLTLDEILSRYVRPGVVPKDVVATAARLSEGLGTVGSTVGPGVGIEDFDAASLTELIEAVRKLLDYLGKNP